MKDAGWRGALSMRMKRKSQSSSGFSIPSRADRSRPQVKHARTAHPDLVPHLNLGSKQAIRLEERLLLTPYCTLRSPLRRPRKQESNYQRRDNRSKGTPVHPFFFFLFGFPCRVAVWCFRCAKLCTTLPLIKLASPPFPSPC